MVDRTGIHVWSTEQFCYRCMEVGRSAGVVVGSQQMEICVENWHSFRYTLELSNSCQSKRSAGGVFGTATITVVVLQVAVAQGGLDNAWSVFPSLSIAEASYFFNIPYWPCLCVCLLVNLTHVYCWTSWTDIKQCYLSFKIPCLLWVTIPIMVLL